MDKFVKALIADRTVMSTDRFTYDEMAEFVSPCWSGYYLARAKQSIYFSSIDMLVEKDQCFYINVHVFAKAAYANEYSIQHARELDDDEYDNLGPRHY